MEATNERIAARLEEIGRLLGALGGNPYRSRAYLRAAETVRLVDEPLEELLERDGLEGLESLPGVGRSISRSIEEMLLRGEWAALERIRAQCDPVRLLATVPSLGPKLAARLHAALGIDTLEDLETAAHDGRLSGFPGIGPKRLAAIRDCLQARLSRVRRGPVRAHDVEPPVGELLDVDREYRERARSGRLRRIAPRRLNPAGEAWLPVLRTRRGPRRYTALFSNTPAAHQAGKTHDWVVLYHDRGDGERVCSVVTAERGPLQGRRVVRGRELECASWYRAREAGEPHGGLGGRAHEGRRLAS